MSVCDPHVHAGLRPPLELIITLAIKAETGFLFSPRERGREREKEIGEQKTGGERGRGRRGASIFHLHSPADMAYQRNLSLDLQNSRLSLSNAVNLAVILHWLTFGSFIWGIFHLMIFIREDWQKRCMCGKASEVEPSNTSVK